MTPIGTLGTRQRGAEFKTKGNKGAVDTFKPRPLQPMTALAVGYSSKSPFTSWKNSDRLLLCR
jgi:hypothetical protein